MLTDNPDFLHFADYFFLVFHSLLIVFNLFGWIWPATRKAHFIVILLAFASWGILGIWYGWGYCPLTDWHWDVLYRLGHDQLPNSYISYLLQRILDWHLPAETVDILTLSLALIALVLSVKVNFYTGKNQK